jgi:hypothetical protein
MADVVEELLRPKPEPLRISHGHQSHPRLYWKRSRSLHHELASKRMRLSLVGRRGSCTVAILSHVGPLASIFRVADVLAW